MSHSARLLCCVAALSAFLSACMTSPWEDVGRTNISVSGAAILTGSGPMLPVTGGSITIDTTAGTLEMTDVAAFAVSSNSDPTKTPSTLPFYSSSVVGPTMHTLSASDLTPAPQFDTGAASTYVIWLRIKGVNKSTTPPVSQTIFAWRRATQSDWGSSGAFEIIE